MSTSLIGKRLGNYDIQSLLGEGGMGSVYLGLHPQIGKKVAIKVLHEELCGKADVVNRFFNEAKAVNDINHPNIVDIIDFGETTFEGSVCKYIIMEYLDGESLAARIRRDGVTIRETLSIIAQCASALAASHAKGVVHRDLKPENVYLCNRPGDKNYIKLLDFGIAKLTTDQGALSQKTRTGMVIGTPTYMSPEQCDGKGNIDHRADIYALGVMMYELLTGRVPFPGEGFGEVLVAHLTREPEPPRTLNPNIPVEIEAIVLRCLRKQKEQRFQSMNDMIAALNDPAPHYQAWMQGAPAPVAGQAVAPNPSLMASASMMQQLANPSLMAPAGMMPNPGSGPSAVWSAVSGPQQMQQQMQLQQQMQMQQMQMQQQMGSGMLPSVQPGQPGQINQMAQMAPSGPIGMGGMMMPGQPGMGPGQNRTGMLMPPPGTPVDMMPVAGAPVVPRSTTLSGASAETAGRRPVNVLLGFAGAIVAGVLVVVGVKLAGGGRTASATRVPKIEPTISVRITSDPSQADIVRADQGDAPIGKTPYTLKLPKGSKPVDIRLHLGGYRDESRTVSASGDQTLELTLAKVPPAVETPPETPPEPKPIKKGREPKIQPMKDPVGKEPKSKEPVAAKEPKSPAKEPVVKEPKAKEPKAKDPIAKEPAGKEPKGGKKKKKTDGDGIMAPVF